MYTTIKQSEVAGLLEKYGYNEIKAKNNNPWWKILFRQFTDILVIILIVASVITAIEGQVADTLVIVFIVLLNGAIGFFQEFKSEKTLKALQNMVHPEVRVIRDDEEQLLDVKYLVPGDIVILGEGDKIPADGVLLESNMLNISEAALTGESLPVKKKIEDEVFMGTNITKGSGVMQVKHTGAATQIGEIAKLAIETKKVMSPLQKELDGIGKFVAKLVLVICSIIFVILFIRDGDFFGGFMYAVSIAISAVPEGLPTTITIALALGATVLAAKNVVVKNISSVETLGAVTTICSDKTGTLTRNEMTVREIYTSDFKELHISGAGYNPKKGEIVGEKESFEAQKIIKISVACNEATLKEKDGVYEILGDPTEGSLLTLAEKFNPGILEKEEEKKTIFPFDSDRKLMSVYLNGEVLTKGSPDSIIEKSKYISKNGEIVAFTNEEKQQVLEQYNDMASRALRVLGFAYKNTENTPSDEKQAESDLVFVGLAGMIDPPRDDVKQAVADAKGAGIRVVVITGDFGLTAGAIAKELGIIEEVTSNNIFTGKEITDLSDKQMKEILSKGESVIFARSMPADKMRIVSILQEMGEVVAMTGDGVNDAPALKKADIGIAMGITGTEVSKESANMILVDDSFSSIVKAVEEGRRIYQNLKKFIWYMFSSNTGELVTIVVSIIFFIPNVLTAILILCINLGTDILPAISMGVGPADKDNMKSKPRDPKSRILETPFIIGFLVTGIFIGLSVVAIFVITLLGDGRTYGMGATGEWRHAMTAAFSGLVVIQMVNTFSAISPNEYVLQTNYLKNKFHLFAVVSSMLLVFAIVYIPFLNEYLKTEPLTLKDWGVIAIFSFLPMISIEFRKYLKKRKGLSLHHG